MKKAGAIIRVSTARQLEGTSPEKQLETILALASEHGYELQEAHIWQLAESGGSRERVGFHEALRAAEFGEISRVYVFSIDRLGRNLLEMLLFLRDLDDLGIDCWSAERQQQLRGDDFIFQIEGAVASKERQEIIKRTQDGLLRAIKGGKYSGGIIAYGYRLNPDSKQLEIEEREAEVVKMIYDWCVEEQISCVQIAERLNAMGVPTHYKKDGRSIKRRGKREAEKTAGIWRAGRVGNMLRNPAYKGLWQWGKRSKKRKPDERIPGYSPAIISDEDFNKAGVVLHNNELFSSRNSQRGYLLRGLIKCSLCGRTYCGSYSRVGPAKSTEKTYYRCNGKSQWKKLGTPECKSLSLNAAEIEAVVWEDIKTFCKNPQVAIQQLRMQRKPYDETLDDKIIEVDRQVAELKRQETNLLRIAASSHEVNTETLDVVLGDNRRSLEALRTYRTVLEAEKLKAKSLEDDLMNVAIRLSKLGNRIEEATFDERRKAVVALVKNITVVPQLVDGKIISVISITYRFNEPCPTLTPPALSVIPDYTSARAATTATRSNRAPVRRAWSPSTRNEFPALCSTGSIFTSRCLG